MSLKSPDLYSNTSTKCGVFAIPDIAKEKSIVLDAQHTLLRGLTNNRFGRRFIFGGFEERALALGEYNRCSTTLDKACGKAAIGLLSDTDKTILPAHIHVAERDLAACWVPDILTLPGYSGVVGRFLKTTQLLSFSKENSLSLGFALDQNLNLKDRTRPQHTPRGGLPLAGAPCATFGRSGLPFILVDQGLILNIGQGSHCPRSATSWPTLPVPYGHPVGRHSAIADLRHRR